MLPSLRGTLVPDFALGYPGSSAGELRVPANKQLRERHEAEVPL